MQLYLYSWENKTIAPVKNRYDLIDRPDNVAFRSKAKKNAIIGGCKNWTYQFNQLINHEAALGNFFLFVPVLAGCGAIWYFHLTFEPSFFKLLLLFLLCILCIILFRSIRIIRLLFFVTAVFTAGALCGKLETLRFDTQILNSTATTTIKGRVLTLEQAIDGSYRLDLQVLDSKDPSLPFLPANIRITARKLPPHAEIGSGLKGLVRLRPPSGPVRNGSYNFSFHNFYAGIGAQGFFMGQPHLVKLNDPESLSQTILLSLASLRINMTKRITTDINGEAGAISAALITGQRGGISDQTNEALRIAGLSHILSISGLHMAMVTGMILVIARFALSCVPLIAMRYPAKKIAAIIALLAASFYLVLSGADVAAQRSYVMVAVMMIAIVFDRSALTMRNLAIAALITILIAPHEILGPSFQMSFAATAALIAIFGWWSTRKKDEITKPVKRNFFYKYIIIPVLSTAVASLVAGFASGIFAAYHFNNTAPLGILGNGLAFPVMSSLVMPFALLAAVLMPLNLEWLPLQIMGFGVEIVKKIAFWVTSISPEINTHTINEHDLIFLTFGLIFVFFLQTRLRITGLILLFTGITMTFITTSPLILIAENGRLVAVYRKNHKIAINEQRPPAYILNNWLTSLRLKDSDVILPNNTKEEGFLCDDFTCKIVLADEKYLTIISNPSFIGDNCKQTDIVVFNYVSFKYPTQKSAHCQENTLIITRRDLALQGTAEIYKQQGTFKVEWASRLPQRPWNDYRTLSKTAIGITD